MIIQEILKNAIFKLNDNKISDAVQKARILLAYTLNVNKEYLMAHNSDEIKEKNVYKYNECIDRLINNVPLQYITNHQEFMKLNFYVDENVLIPRADTEILVEEVISNCKQNVEKNYKILDLCAGSGAIGISISKYITNSYVLCTDISDKAIEVARKNAELNKIDNIKFMQSDMFKNVEGKFDIIVSNPPYIKKDIISSLDKEVQNEPIIALDGGDDGLNFYRIIVDEAYNYLNENGKLFLEIGYDQKNEVIEIINQNGKYKDIYSKKDLYGNDRIIVATAK